MELLHESGYIIAERYRIIETLGQGGIGTTYQAEDLQNSQRVALKALSLKGMSDWKMTELFEREARVLSVLNHPGIPKYIDYFQVDTESDRGFYIAQQIAPGKSLAVLVETGWHANESEVRQIAIQILEILVYLHKQTPPVIHRDIKPQNIIRDDKGQVFLVDFGAVQDTYHSTFARSSTVVGTFGYMAPEQFRGQAVPTTDLYGLGATLLFLLTHRSPADLPQDRLKIDFRSRVQISGDFADFLEKLLEPDVEDRFVSAKEALDVLRGKRNLAGKSGAGLSWKTLLGVGVAGIVGFIVFNSFKYTILKSIGINPSGICQAINNNQIDIVRNYLNQGGNVNDIDTDAGISLLDCALRFSKKDMAELLITKITDVNAKDNQGATPLHKIRSKEMFELLIAKGADVNAKDNQGRTPLHFLPYQPNSKELVELLIAKGADVNARNNQGATPLHFLTSQPNSKELVELLIAKGADVNAKNNQGQTLLHLLNTSQPNSKELVELLIAKGADVNAKNNQGQTLLHLLNTSSYHPYREELCELLIAKGADVNAKDNQGQTPIQISLKNNNLNLVLIEKGAYLSDKEINAKNNRGRTPIQIALKRNNWNAVTYLIEKGAYLSLSDEDIKTKDYQGNQPIHWAARNGNQKSVNLLIAKGADVNAKNYQGDTPLLWAASTGRKEIVELLLAKGADFNTKNYQGDTPLLWATSTGGKEIVELLLTKGANLNAKDNKGSTPLKIAISFKEIESYDDDYKQTIKLLIAKGSEVNVEALLGNGRTPLHLAALANWPDVAEMLIAKGAKINIKNVYGETPLHNAAQSGNKNIVEVLLAKGKGLEVNSRDNDGFTPLGLAEENNYSDIVELLKSHGGIE
ncbi:ankyrin repeat domain-containing protein [Anabaena sp. WFMT]|uniref:ankyrin repeat domain-containing protein n=1 Tax=Anabaena sp. WFMT TaxID=3449730 RepID=UPI003F28980B